jgi:hypothetical protein
MDGKATWRDNVFVERLWRSVKYEEVYLRAYRQRLHLSRAESCPDKPGQLSVPILLSYRSYS